MYGHVYGHGILHKCEGVRMDMFMCTDICKDVCMEMCMDMIPHICKDVWVDVAMDTWMSMRTNKSFYYYFATECLIARVRACRYSK